MSWVDGQNFEPVMLHCVFCKLTCMLKVYHINSNKLSTSFPKKYYINLHEFQFAFFG